MPIILPHDLTTAEIRVLQEFRRLNADRLPVDTIKAIKHPSGGGETPAAGLASKGFLTFDNDGGFVVTEKARSFLAIDARPMFEESTGSGGSDDAEVAADGV